MRRPAGSFVTRRLDHLPIVAQALSALRIREIVDERVPLDERSHVTTGECVEAMIAAIILGRHTLYRVDELLAPFDLETAFGWRFGPERLNDTRLGKALCDVFRSGASAIHADAVASAVEVYELELKRLHFDTSTAVLHGDYRFSREAEDPEEPDAVPHVTYGHSKDYRPDLKQIVLGLTVTADGPVPIAGRGASGNREDGLEAEFSLRELAAQLPDLSEVVLVGDSKLFSGRRLQIFEYLDLGYITLLPRSVGVWAEAFERFRRHRAEGNDLPVLKHKDKPRSAREPRHDEGRSGTGAERAGASGSGGDGSTRARRSSDLPQDEWRGVSFDMTYNWKNEEDDNAIVPLAVRLLVVESSVLRRRKESSLKRRREAEAKRLKKKAREIAKREYHCAQDAEADAQALGKPAPRFHALETAVRSEEVRVKRSRRGRPKKGEPHRYKRVWRIDVEVSESPGAFEDALLNESCFVLSTNLPREGKRAHSDTEILEAYDEQHTVEGCLRWAKRPCAMAPIFLKSEERIAALVAVYVLALMVYGLIQRQIRRLLQAEGTTMPGNRGQGWTNKPTTEVLFRLFEGMFTVRGDATDGEVVVTNMNTEQVRILRLLRCPLLTARRVTIEEPRKPRPGERAWRPTSP